MTLFEFGGLKIIRQTAKLNTPPIILRIRYVLTVLLDSDCQTYSEFTGNNFTYIMLA